MEKDWSQQVILNELKRLNDTLEAIRASTVENTSSLKEHMYRTELNEKHIGMLELEFKQRAKEFSGRIQPIEDHIKFVNKLSKYFVTLFALPGAIYYILNIYKMLNQ